MFLQLGHNGVLVSPTRSGNSTVIASRQAGHWTVSEITAACCVPIVAIAGTGRTNTECAPDMWTLKREPQALQIVGLVSPGRSGMRTSLPILQNGQCTVNCWSSAVCSVLATAEELRRISVKTSANWRNAPRISARISSFVILTTAWGFFAWACFSHSSKYGFQNSSQQRLNCRSSCISSRQSTAGLFWFRAFTRRNISFWDLASSPLSKKWAWNAASGKFNVLNSNNKGQTRPVSLPARFAKAPASNNIQFLSKLSFVRQRMPDSDFSSSSNSFCNHSVPEAMSSLDTKLSRLWSTSGNHLCKSKAPSWLRDSFSDQLMNTLMVCEKLWNCFHPR